MSKKRVLFLGGGVYHPFAGCADILKTALDATNRFETTLTEDREALRLENLARYDAVMIYTDGGALTPDQARGLTTFVAGGGACVGLHGATASFNGCKEYAELMGGVFAGHGAITEFPVKVADPDHYITQRVRSFRVTDELYTLDRFDPDAHILLTATWRHRDHPMAYTRAHGAGKVFYFAIGHDEAVFSHPEFQKLTIRGLDWTLGAESRKPLKAGVIGYGASFNMGKMHLTAWRDAAGFTPVAACDLLPERCMAALEDFPGIQTFESADEMLVASDMEAVTIITEHFSHAALAIQCLEAGRHVVCEKPFCITVAEADAMIDAARANGVMLSVFHNRRWDGDYQTIKSIVESGRIGEVFHIEQCMGGYNHPGFWWRSHKPIAGGAFYDWGAHCTDQVLGLVSSPIREVSGFFVNDKVWRDVSVEDHCQAVIRFENGCFASIEQSSAAAIGKPRWRILGTRGGIVETKEWETCKVVHFENGLRMESEVKYLPGDWHAYYRNVADHLLLGEPLAVTPESARRVISVIETAEASSKAGKALEVPAHCR